jgi:hypothetical protein
MNTNGRSTENDPNVTAGVRGLAFDAVELAELQGQLFVLDVKIASRQARIGLVFGTIGVCLLLGCIPVALFALAEVFVARLGWSQAAALAVAAAIGLAASAVAGAVAWRRLRAGLASLQRSRDELNRNITWIKSNLRRDTPTSYSETSTRL